MEMNKKAWAILTEDEKSSLTLQFGMNKSSWESGEILNRSHYKYLEIKYRAEFFLKLFTEHFGLYDEVIPEYILGDKLVIQFFKLCIGKRKKPMDAILAMEADIKLTKSLINERINDQMEKWAKSKNAHVIHIYDLIKEYDRWNNFRILPKHLQEPSAYKRRIKNSYKKHLKIINNLNPLSIKKLIKLYSVNKKPCLFMPIAISNDYQVVMVKENKQSLKIINSIGIYLFKDKVDADLYLELVEDYTSKVKKECKDGLHFWPKYREIIKKAKNYNEILQITPTRKYLQMAVDRLEFL